MNVQSQNCRAGWDRPIGSLASIAQMCIAALTFEYLGVIYAIDSCEHIWLAPLTSQKRKQRTIHGALSFFSGTITCAASFVFLKPRNLGSGQSRMLYPGTLRTQ